MTNVFLIYVFSIGIKPYGHPIDNFINLFYFCDLDRVICELGVAGQITSQRHTYFLSFDPLKCTSTDNHSLRAKFFLFLSKKWTPKSLPNIHEV